MRTIDRDVVIIGTGFGAVAPALRLAQAGLRVTLLEKGPRIGIGDFRQTQDPAYLTRYLKALSGDALSLTYAEALGGGSGFYEMVSLRAPSQAFEQRAGGRRLWPAGLDRATLDPYYALAERMLNVEQIAPGDVPKSGLVFSLLMKNLGYSCDRARYAVRGCLGSGFCVTGCIYGAKQSLHLNYLPQAEAAGATIECGVTAVRIEPLGDPGRTAGVERLAAISPRYAVVCRQSDGTLVRYAARIVVLAGGTVGTARLLLASRPHLGLLSEHVGRNIAYNGSVKAAGILPDGFPDGDMFAGRSHPGMISYEFLARHGFTISAAKPLPVQALVTARLRLDGDTRRPAWWGEAHVDLMRQYRHRMIVLVTFGLTPPGGRLTLDADGAPRLELAVPRTVEAYYKTAHRTLESILTRNGCRLVHADMIDRSGAPREGLFFSTAHQVGSARMGTSPRHAVTDASGEVFGYPGLYVSDGAAIPSSLAVNTSLTILANAERIAAGILRRYDLGEARVAA
jgi:choline dehydrogenase-like flavoprotein